MKWGKNLNRQVAKFAKETVDGLGKVVQPENRSFNHETQQIHETGTMKTNPQQPKSSFRVLRVFRGSFFGIWDESSEFGLNRHVRRAYM